MEIYHFKKNICNAPVECVVCDSANGLTVTLSGGDREHIGAVAVKCPGQDISTIEFEGHRESVISNRWAQILSDRLDSPVVVSCGIHYDTFSKDMIKDVLSGTDKMLDEVLDALLHPSDDDPAAKLKIRVLYPAIKQ